MASSTYPKNLTGSSWASLDSITGVSPNARPRIRPILQRSPFQRSRSFTAFQPTLLRARRSPYCRKTAMHWPTFSVPDPTDITVRGPGNLGFDPVGETTQDISIAATAARGASIAVYFTTYDQVGWVDLLLRVIHPNVGDPICSVLSSSFYVSNGDDPAELAIEGVTTGWLDAFSAALQDAAIQGVTFCTVSGDYGVNSSAYGGAPSDGKQHVVYPGSDPWALCCGGTTIGNIIGGSFDEYVWNDPAPGQLWGATGGGISDFFDFLPSYQVDAGVPVSIKDGHVGRGVPDVAANASINSGYPIIIE